MPESRILNPESSPKDRGRILLWLTLCAILVAMMVVIGGYTRLSGSGLSITSWKPIHGIIPPLNDVQWQQEFAAYQQSPQFQKENSDMRVDDFKAIFWPEFIHRLLGRLIGLVFFVPLVIFAARRSFSARFGWRLMGIFALGGLQGVIGWLMVASGLVDTPQVSAVRLMLHLAVALAILGLLVWAVMDIMGRGIWAVKRDTITTYYTPRTTFVLWFALLCLQILLGALMAGTHAGLLYNTWPLMNGQFVPDGLGSDRLALIQFLHRNVAVLVSVGFIFWWFFSRAYVKNAQLGKICAVLLFSIATQFTLGVITLLQAVPLDVAWAHQTVALLLFTVALITLHKIRYKQ